MSDAISIAYPTGGHLYIVLRTSDDLFVSGTTPEPLDASHLAAYALAIPEVVAGTGQYSVPFPALAAGIYFGDVYSRSGGAPSWTDPAVADADFYWTGTAFYSPVASFGMDFRRSFLPARVGNRTSI